MTDVAGLAAEGEFARVHRAAGAIGQSQCVRHLRERDFGSAARRVPRAIFFALSARNVSTKFSTECVDLHFEADPACRQVCQVDGNRFEVETARKRDRSESEPIVSPRSCAA